MPFEEAAEMPRTYALAGSVVPRSDRLDAVPIELPAPGNYRLNPAGSRIAITATHGLGWPVRGSFAVIDGQVDVPENPADAILTAAIDATSLNTGNRLRDMELRSPMFLGVKKYPTIDFSAAGPHLRRDDTWHVTGTVTACGTSAPAELMITDVDLTDTGFTARATTRIDRYAHGVTAARGAAGQYLDLVITVAAQR